MTTIKALAHFPTKTSWRSPCPKCNAPARKIVPGHPALTQLLATTLAARQRKMRWAVN